MALKTSQILLVEDNPADAIFLKEEILVTEPDKFSVTVAETLAKAVKTLKNSRFDAMLLDLNLPDSAGLDTILKICNEAPDLPIVVLTGSDDENTGVEAIRQGAQDYLIKGKVDYHLISRTIRYAIERKIAQQEREITIDLLKLVNSSRLVDDALKSAVAFFRDKLNCKAVGIRFKYDGGYPLYHAVGFSEQFIASETSLLARDSDNRGKPTPKCICNDVILGRLDPSLNFFTAKGSFWTNNASQLFKGSENSAPMCQMTPSCAIDGFESILIIPLNAGNERLGILQFHDHRKEKFTAEMVYLWERLADSFALNLAKLQSDELLQKNEEQKRIEQEVLMAVERQQRQIGQNLHDSIQGSLAGIGFMLDALKRSIIRDSSSTDKLASEADYIAGVARQTIEQTRALARGLSPVALQAGNLAESLSHLASTTTDLFNINCLFNSNGVIPAQDEVTATQLYYICQEAVNNSLKHSKCKSIIISLNNDNRQLQLTIEDDGIGPGELVSNNKSMGLWTMTCRAKMIGGTLEIRKRDTGGTMVNCVLPHN